MSRSQSICAALYLWSRRLSQHFIINALQHIRSTHKVSVIGVLTCLSVLLGSVRSAQAVTISKFSLPTRNSDPEGITSGPDGNLWFTEYQNNKIGRITPDGTITEYAAPGSITITNGPDGNLWFAELFNNKIGRITTSGVITEYSLPIADSVPWGITSGPDGNLWFTECNNDLIGRITVNGNITQYPLTTLNNGLEGITSGPDGNLWFTETDGNKIGRITPSGVITEYSVPTANSKPVQITSGPDGNLWFTEFAANQIGRITPAGAITEYPLATTNSEPMAITNGPDGNLWFAAHGWIERITPSGSVAAYASDDSSEGITTGPDGNLWFTAGDNIERLTPDVAHLALTLSALNGSVVAGNNLAATYTITNSSPTPAQNVTFSTTLPANVTFLSNSSSPGLTQTGSTITANLGTLGANTTIMIVVAAQTSASTPNGGSLTSSATITSSTTDNYLPDNSASGTTLITTQADVAVTQQSTPTVNADNTISYTLTITNNGLSDARNVTLSDGLPANTTFVAAMQTSGPAFTLTTPAVGSAGTLDGQIAALPPGAVATFNIMVQVSATAPDTSQISNTASVTSNTSDPVASNNTASTSTTIVNQADLTATQTGPATANVRDNLSYALSVTNNGPVTAHHVMLADSLSAATAFVALTPNGNFSFYATTPAVGTNGLVTATLSALAPGATATFTLIAQVNASTTNSFQVSNTLMVSSDTYDPTPANNSATATTLVSVTAPPTPTPAPTSTPIPTPILVPTFTPVPVPTATPVPTPTPILPPSLVPTPLPPLAPGLSIQFNSLIPGGIYHSLLAVRGNVSESNVPATAHLKVQVKAQRRSDGKYFNGKSWSQKLTWLPATVGKGAWALASNLLPHNSAPGQLLPDSKYTFTAVAADGTGYNATAAVTISIDVTPPILAITTPRDGAVMNSLNVIGGKALDAPGGTGTHQIILTLARLSDGHYWNGTAFVMAPKVKGQLQPPALAVSVAANNGGWAQRTSLPQGTTLFSGAYRITAIAVDAADNRSQAISYFTIDAPPTAAPPSTVKLSSATANVTLNSVSLKFIGALAADAASDPTHYSAVVNDHAAVVESAGYDASMHTVILGLTDGSLRVGDRIVIKWRDLTDASDKTVSGQTELIIAH